MPPAGTVTYRFPDNTKSLRSKDFSDPLTSIARRRGSSYILRVLYNPEGGCGIWTHAWHHCHLTVFKTVPLNQTWVILHKINQNQYLALGDGPPRFRWQSIIAPYSGQFLQPQRDGIGLGTSLFTLRYDFKVVHWYVTKLYIFICCLTLLRPSIFLSLPHCFTSGWFDWFLYRVFSTYN